jgi:hypothetical protein
MFYFILSYLFEIITFLRITERVILKLIVIDTSYLNCLDLLPENMKALREGKMQTQEKEIFLLGKELFSA